MKNLSAIICALSALAPVQGAGALNMRHLHDAGISSGYITGIDQDADGYIWVATEDGLNRFDGRRFSTFTTWNSGIAANELNDVCFNPQYPSHIWIATQRNGVSTLNLSTGKITSIDADLLRSPDVTSITPASDGSFWLTHYHFGAQLINPHTLRSRYFDQASVKGLPTGAWTMAEGADGRIFIGHVHNGFSVADTAAMTAVNYSRADGLPGESVYSIFTDTNGHVWIGTEGGAALFNPVTHSITPFVHNETRPGSIAPGRVHCIRGMKNGEIWFATSQGGISVLDSRSYAYADISDARFTTIPSGSASSATKSAEIRTLFQDRYGNIWIGNHRSGIDMASHIRPMFSRMSASGAGDSRSADIHSWSITKAPDGTIWTGGNNCIMKWEGSTCRSIPLPDSPMNSRTIVRAIRADRNGNIWIGTFDRGCFLYNTASRSFTHIADITCSDVRTFYPLPSGLMLVGTTAGIYLADGSSARKADTLNSRLNDLIIQDMLVDPHGNLWVGTFGKGLFIFGKDKSVIASHDIDGGFISNAINALRTDNKGRVWVATRNGIAIFSPSSVKNFSTVPALRNAGITHVKSLEADNGGNLWLSTNKGIACIGAENLNLTLFSDSPRLPLNSFIENASVAIPDSGKIYFSSDNGVLIVDPSFLNNPLPSPFVRATEIAVYDNKGSRTDNERILPIPADNSLSLPWGSNNFRITFNIADPAVDEYTETAYCLKGLNDIWIDSHNDNTAIFRNIPPGNYSFQVKTRRHGSEWSDPSTILNITVEPPLYLTWWAKTLYVVAICTLLYLIAFFYRQRMVARQKLKEKMASALSRQTLNEERLRFYTNVTHELRTPLTLILGPLEDLVSDPALPPTCRYKMQMIRNSANTLLDLINGILEFRKTETQNRRLTLVHGNLANRVRELGLRYKELNRNPDVRYIMDIEENSPNLWFDPEMLSTILNNLLSNAMKYTPKGSITISCRTVSGTDGRRRTHITVADTGYGISQEGLAHIFERYYQVRDTHQASGTGIGLALVKSLCDLHHADLSVESQKNRGTSFTLSLLTDCDYPGEARAAACSRLSSPAAPLPDAGVQPEEQTPEKRRFRVLVVEDNDDIREYIRQELRDEMEIITARNGLEGLEKVQNNHPDIVISDIMMPEMDGVTMCRHIKEDILSSHIPVILLTAKDSLLDREEGYDAGADSYLTKPFSARLLRSRLHSIINIRRRIAEFYMNQPIKQPDSSIPVPESKEAQQSQPKTEIAHELPAIDRKFMQKITSLITENLMLEDLGVAFLADKMCMSTSTLYRKINAIVGVSTNEYIRRIRMNRAAALLLEGELSITEIAFQTGFGSHSSFAKAFKKEFGTTASEYVSTVRTNGSESITPPQS